MNYNHQWRFNAHHHQYNKVETKLNRSNRELRLIFKHVQKPTLKTNIWKEAFGMWPL